MATESFREILKLANSATFTKISEVGENFLFKRPPERK